MAFIALKPCNFGGLLYKKGDVIDESAIEQGMVKKLIAMGKIKLYSDKKETKSVKNRTKVKEGLDDVHVQSQRNKRRKSTQNAL